MEDRIPTIVLVGSTGVGKSSLCNRLSGTNEFEVGNSLFSLTNKPQEIIRHLGGDPSRREVKIIDLPGFNDNVEGLLGFIKVINDLKEIFEKGVDIVLYCCEPKGRIDSNDLYDLKNIKDMMKAENFKNNMILTVTKLDSRTDKEEMIRKYTESIDILLGKNQIDFSVTMHGMLFPDFNDFNNSLLDPLERILSHIEPMKVVFNEAHKTNLPGIFKIFQTEVGQKILDRTKKRIEDKLTLKRLKHADEDSLRLLKDTLDCINIVKLEEGKTIAEIDKNSTNHKENPDGFIRDLLKFFTSMESNQKDATLYYIVRDIMHEFNEEDKKKSTAISKSNFQKSLMEAVQSRLGERLIKAFEALVIKHLQITDERLENLETSEVLHREIDIRLISASLSTTAGSFLSSLILSDLTVITFTEEAATLSVAGATVAECGAAGAVALTSVSLAAILGVAVIVGITIGGLLYICWDRNNAVDEAAKMFCSNFVKNEETFKTLISVALSYLKIGKMLEGM